MRYLLSTGHCASLSIVARLSLQKTETTQLGYYQRHQLQSMRCLTNCEQGSCSEHVMLSVIWLWVSRREAHTYGRYKSNTSTDNFPRKAQSYSASEQAKANNGISNLKGANPLVYWKLFVDHNIIESSVMWLKFFWGVPPLLCLENYDTASCGHEIISLIVKLVPVTVPIGQSVRVFTGDTSQSVTTHELKSLTKSLHFWDNHLSSAFV